MSLRLRLFLVFGGLVALLVLAQWWWVRVLTRDLSSEIDKVASSVGHSVVAFFSDHESDAPGKILECLDGDCEDITLLEENIDFEHHIVPEHSEPDGRHDASGEGNAPERKVLIQRFRRGQPADNTPETEDGEPVGFSYRVGYRTAEGSTPAVDKSEALIQKHVQLHIEHKEGDRYLWMAGPGIDHRVRIPQGFRAKLEQLSQRLILGSAGFLALGLVLAAVLAHGVTAPLRQLSDAARRLGDGALGTRVPVNADGEVGQALTAFNRMSSRLEELDQRNRELSARKHLGEIGEISRGLAHTLRNPLNALGLSVEELAAGGAGGDAAELAESARRQIRRIDSSLKSFLALASQSGGVIAEVDLGELIEDVALEALQDSRGKARLDLEPMPDRSPIRAVEPELRAVLQALLVNAIEASPEGGRVAVRGTMPAPGRWRVEIEDQGPGLPREIRSRLFTPHLSTKANGSGMGLFLAHRIATSRYRGSLELVDRDDGGAVRGTRAILEIGERKDGEANDHG